MENQFSERVILSGLIAKKLCDAASFAGVLKQSTCFIGNR